MPTRLTWAQLVRLRLVCQVVFLTHGSRRSLLEPKRVEHAMPKKTHVRRSEEGSLDPCPRGASRHGSHQAAPRSRGRTEARRAEVRGAITTAGYLGDQSPGGREWRARRDDHRSFERRRAVPIGVTTAAATTVLDDRGGYNRGEDGARTRRDDRGGHNRREDGAGTRDDRGAYNRRDDRGAYQPP